MQENPHYHVKLMPRVLSSPAMMQHFVVNIDVINEEQRNQKVRTRVEEHCIQD